MRSPRTAVTVAALAISGGVSVSAATRTLARPGLLKSCKNVQWIPPDGGWALIAEQIQVTGASCPAAQKVAKAYLAKTHGGGGSAKVAGGWSCKSPSRVACRRRHAKITFTFESGS